MPRSTEIDPTPVIREAMITRRNAALADNNFDDAVLFSHVIAALAYCIELEGAHSRFCQCGDDYTDGTPMCQNCGKERTSAEV